MTTFESSFSRNPVYSFWDLKSFVIYKPSAAIKTGPGFLFRKSDKAPSKTCSHAVQAKKLHAEHEFTTPKNCLGGVRNKFVPGGFFMCVYYLRFWTGTYEILIIERIRKTGSHWCETDSSQFFASPKTTHLGQ